jgi:hypothetical protein
VAVLKFNGKGEWKILHNVMELTNDGEAMIEIAHVIVSHFKNK